MKRMQVCRRLCAFHRSQPAEHESSHATVEVSASTWPMARPCLVGASSSSHKAHPLLRLGQERIASRRPHLALKGRPGPSRPLAVVVFITRKLHTTTHSARIMHALRKHMTFASLDCTQHRAWVPHQNPMLAFRHARLVRYSAFVHTVVACAHWGVPPASSLISQQVDNLLTV